MEWPAPLTVSEVAAELRCSEDEVRALIRVPRRDAAALAASLHAAQSLRSARKDTEVVRVQLDPAELI